MTEHYTCSSCEAEFKIKHKLDPSYYEVNFCPFCGGTIEEEEWDDDDREYE